jgi:predicted AAA+ superfamily ATPase
MEKRRLYLRIWDELSRDKSMIFLAGPRQAGKTTLAKMISGSFTNHLYFNWDIIEHRTGFYENPNFFESVKRKDQSTPLIILDEMHKYREWKNYLKGVYDQFHDRYKFLVSGSGRLDLYQKGGDSLAGRYYLFHLWPFTIAELGRCNKPIKEFLNNPLKISIERDKELSEIWSQLSILSGFPEPYLSGRITTYRRWSNIYAQQLIREDIRDLTDIKSIADVETLYSLLPSKIGSPLSIQSLAGNLRVSYNTVKNWLYVFERFFLTFSISPWTVRITRAIQKERKVYLFDIPRIKETSARFENMAAIELWRAITSWNDMGYGHFTLHFIKNKEQQEVDFLIADDGVPLFLIETKLSDAQPSTALRLFQRALKIPAVQLVAGGDSFRMFSHEEQTILIAPAHHWLARLP